ncbi:putative protein phosphatase 2C 80 [Primulina tabacum]|uniref:putative protein phosphatase 2C 80 n=1 Tax=Primulina tabacum TaxID=48773 RepID=UPI003F590838
MPAQAGDILILGTDCVFENLFTKDIRDVANFLEGAGADPDQFARSIAEHPYYNSIDKSAFTPFTEASLRNGMAYCGGKKDDLTVVVAFIICKLFGFFYRWVLKRVIWNLDRLSIAQNFSILALCIYNSLLSVIINVTKCIWPQSCNVLM